MANATEAVAGPIRSDPFSLLNDLRVPSGLIENVNTESFYGFYGPFNVGSWARSAADYVSAQTGCDANALDATLVSFLTLAKNDCLKYSSAEDLATATEAGWFCIRMFKPTEEYVQPRWHRDGRMFSCACSATPPSTHFKYAVALLGPSTRILAPSRHVDGVMDSVGNWDENRHILAERLAGQPELLVGRQQMIKFSWGQNDSPVHSEPDFSGQDRVFISVLFGNEKEIRIMCDWRGEEYGKAEEF